MKITAAAIEVVELFALGGKSLGLFRVDSEWNGFKKLRSLERDEVVIIDVDPSHAVGGILYQLIGVPTEVTVVKASPDFLLAASDAATKTDAIRIADR